MLNPAANSDSIFTVGFTVWTPFSLAVNTRATNSFFILPLLSHVFSSSYLILQLLFFLISHGPRLGFHKIFWGNLCEFLLNEICKILLFILHCLKLWFKGFLRVFFFNSSKLFSDVFKHYLISYAKSMFRRLLWFGHLARMQESFWSSTCRKFEVGSRLAKGWLPKTWKE